MFRKIILMTPIVAAIIAMCNLPCSQADAGAKREAGGHRHQASGFRQEASDRSRKIEGLRKTGSHVSSGLKPTVSNLTSLAPSTTDEEPLSSELLALRDKIRHARALYLDKCLNTRDHNPWEVMHGIVAYGVDTQLFVGGPDGEPKNAISWVCWDKRCHGIPLLERRGDEIHARKGPYVQGHYGQFLAILAQSRVKMDYPMRAGGKTFTVADLVETEKKTCQPKTELTFKLISLSHYLDLNETWENESGQQWSIPRLIHEELPQPITHTAACGGTHRLFGLAYAVRKREQRGEPIDGEYARVREYLDNFHRYTFKLQNNDGSFSTEWFKRRGNSPDLDRRLQTTGHILEWLVFSLPEDDLTDPRVTKAVNYLADIMIEGERRNWEVGPRGHALHALAIYDERLFENHNGRDTAQIARKETTNFPQPPRISRAHRTTNDATQAVESISPAKADEKVTAESGPVLLVP